MDKIEKKLDYNGSTYINKLIKFLNKVDIEEIDNAVDLIIQAWKEGRQIITLGNGGSSMTALHMITDWNKSIFLATGKKLKGRSLVDNIGLIMAYGNDINFESIFVEQLKNIMNPGDLVIAISGSGNSENVLEAIKYANENKGTTLGLCGYDGGKLKEMSANVVWANVNDMQISEDFHSIFGHIVMQRICSIN
jgi:D-sedoheptulose 7-phosphate isomerase